MRTSVSEFRVATKAVTSLVALPPKSRTLGYVPDPEAYFAREKQKIWDAVRDLSNFRITYGRILIGQWHSEARPFLADGSQGGIIRPDLTNDAAKYNGLTGLVLKMGPHAYEANETIEWAPEEMAKVGDWVVCAPSDGRSIMIWDQICTLIENEHAIRAIISRPDIV